MQRHPLRPTRAVQPDAPIHGFYFASVSAARPVTFLVKGGTNIVAGLGQGTE